MGDVGAVATLADDIFKWALVDPRGYATLSFNDKLETLHVAARKALDAKEYGVVDRVLAELERMSTVFV